MGCGASQESDLDESSSVSLSNMTPLIPDTPVNNGADARKSLKKSAAHKSSAEGRAEAKAANNKRIAVAAQVLMTGDVTEVPKAKEQEALILKSVRSNRLFEHLGADLITAVVGTMAPKQIESGQCVISQGEPGTNFYVLEKGVCEVYLADDEDGAADGPVPGSRMVTTLQPGASFGELALMYNSPRAATVYAKTTCYLWVLEQANFLLLKKKHAEKMQNDVVALVESVPAFQSFGRENLLMLADALESVVPAMGDFIVTQGEKGDTFYIIQKGEVDITNENGGLLGQLGRGGVFGEQALIQDDVRQANVVAATNDVELLCLRRQVFVDLLGPLQTAWRFDCLREVPLLAAVPDEDIRKLAEKLAEEKFKENDYVFRKGDHGEHLYVLEAGSFKVMDGDFELALLREKATCFGELALMNSDVRAADVLCVSPVGTVLKLARKDLEDVVGSLVSLQSEWRMEVLNKVPLLQSLTDDQRKLIAEAMEMKLVPGGTTVIEKGTIGNTFYIIERGMVGVNDGQIEVKTLGEGQYFGERALLTKEERSMNVVSKGTCSLLEINEKIFVQVVGPLQKILETQVDVYDSRSNRKLKVTCLEEMNVKGILGMGAFGKVLLCGYRSKNYAVKCLQKQHVLTYGLQNHLMQEKEVMADCASDFLVNLCGTFKDTTTLYMILEVVQGGELYNYLQNQDDSCIPEAQAKFYAACTVMAFEYMQDRHYAHRDLKPENLLIDSIGYLKLADFGFAKRVKGQKAHTMCGTPDYMAPELVKQSGHTYAVDWWATGVLIYEMQVGLPPFFADDDLDRMKKITKAKPDYPPSISAQCRDLIKAFLTVNPSKRLGMLKGKARDIKGHPWFKGYDWNEIGARTKRAPYIPSISNEDDTSNFEEFGANAKHPAEGGNAALSLRSGGVFDEW